MIDHLFYIATKTWISAILARLGRIARFDPTIGQLAEQEPETWNPQRPPIGEPHWRAILALPKPKEYMANAATI